MPVSTPILPDVTTQTPSVYKTNIDAVLASMARTGLTFAPHEESVPTMTLRLDSGVIGAVGALPTGVNAQSTGTITAPSTNPRNDIVYIDATTGAVGVAPGTEAASPADPAIPSGKIAVAMVSLTTSTMTITNSIITELRNSGLGTAAMATVAAGGTGDLLRTDGDGSGLYGIVSGATVAEKSQIAQNSFFLYAQTALVGSNTANGWVDVFTDQTGIDTVGSLNLTYDAVNHLYDNIGSVTSAASGWTVGSKGMTFSADTVGPVTTTDGSVYNNTTFTTDTYIQSTLTFTSGTGNEMSMGFFDNGELGTFDSTINSGGLSSMTKAWWIESSASGAFDVKYGTTIVLAGTAITTNDIVKFNRSGDTITLSVNGTVRHTFAQSATGVTTRSILGVYRTDSSQLWRSVSWTGTPPNMTLISNASTALSTPTIARVYLWEVDVAAITLNTDLKAYASRDGGTTWTQITLAVATSLTTGQILTGAVDISAQPAGTSIKYKIEILNAKELKIHGVQLSWS